MTDIDKLARELSSKINSNRERVVGGYGGENQIELIKSALLQVQREAVPEGWQLVPKELTADMRQAMFSHSCKDPVVSEMNDLWSAMLAAAPKPPKKGE